jgi:hypothetical protein
MTTKNVYPTVHEDPRDGRGCDVGYYYCKNCVEFGDIIKVEEDNYPHPPENNSIRRVPCVVCAMANGGAWGWKEGHKGEKEHLLKSNGQVPGNSGIEDILSGHSHEPWSNWDVSDEEVVLGFVQYGLYNHHTWEEIIDVGEGPSRNRPSLPPSSYLNQSSDRYKDNWYWWKVIPYSVVLPKRLIKVMKEMLKDYTEGSEIPEDRQNLAGREYEEGTWEYLFETYIEPAHVVHLFIKTLKRVLQRNIGEFDGHNTITNFHKHKKIPRAISQLLYSDESLEWLACSNSQMDNEITSSGENEGRVHYLVRGTGDIFEEGYDHTVLNILDRDIFGTCLMNVIGYDWKQFRSFNRDGIILDTLERPPSPDDLNILWRKNNYRELYEDVYKKITFQITEGVFTSYPEQHLDDYDCEESFRLLINTFREEYENEDESDDESDDEEEKKSIDTKEIITKLQEFEEIIDEDVKEKVSENVYKVMLEKLHEVYKIVK